MEYKHYVDKTNCILGPAIFCFKSAGVLERFAEDVDFPITTKISLNDIVCLEFEDGFLFTKVISIMTKKDKITANCNYINVFNKPLEEK